MIDDIRKRLMLFIGDRDSKAKGWTSVLVPKMEKLLQKHVSAGQHWIVNRSNSKVYKVLGDFKCRVDISSWSCSYFRWKLYGFPCVHAIIVMKFLRVDMYQHVEDYFKVSTSRECYSYPIYPIIHTSMN